MSEQTDIIPQTEWKHHPWLSQVTLASDMDGDAAFFIPDTDADAAAALEGVRLEYSYDGENWESVEPVNSGTFPSREWACAAWAWYWPFLDHPLLGIDADREPTIQWRAVLHRPSSS